VALDVLRALDLAAQSGAHQHTNTLRADERRIFKRPAKGTTNRAMGATVSLLLGPTVPSIGLVSESGLYKLIMRCDKPNARPFQDWGSREVLPSIRKMGSSAYWRPLRDSQSALRGLRADFSYPPSRSALRRLHESLRTP
jgi:prophage antirepressor-like protein